MKKRIFSRHIVIKMVLEISRGKVEIQPRRHERGVGAILCDMCASEHASVHHIFVQIKPEYHIVVSMSGLFDWLTG